MTKTEKGADVFISFEAGFTTGADFVFSREGFSLIQIQIKAAMPMMMAVIKNLLPGLFGFGAEENCLRNGTVEFKYKTRFHPSIIESISKLVRVFCLNSLDSKLVAQIYLALFFLLSVALFSGCQSLRPESATKNEFQNWDHRWDQFGAPNCCKTYSRNSSRQLARN